MTTAFLNTTRRPMRLKDASRAAVNNLKDVRFTARRNQHGFTVGDVTQMVHGFPVDRVKRFIRHGILICEPMSNFMGWGKDVSAWLLKSKLPAPVTVGDLIVAQAAMAADDPSLITYAEVVEEPKQPDTIPQAGETEITELHAAFLQMRGYTNVTSVEAAKEFVAHLSEEHREGFLKEASQWEIVEKTEHPLGFTAPSVVGTLPPADVVVEGTPVVGPVVGGVAELGTVLPAPDASEAPVVPQDSSLPAQAPSDQPKVKKRTKGSQG